MAEKVELAVKGSLLDHLFVAVVTAKGLAVHHEAAGGRHGEPAHVELGVRLTGTEELPFAALSVRIGHPYFDPGMVVIAVCPTGGVALAGRDAHRAEGGDGKGALLTAAAQRSAQGGERCRGAAVGGTVGHMLVAPVVHLEGSLFHGHALHTLFKLMEHILASSVEVLVIDTVYQHKMAEDVFGYHLAPGHLLAGSEGIAHLVEEKGRCVVGQVAVRHVGVEELHGFALGTAEGVEL